MRIESRTVTPIQSETVVKPGSLKLRFKWVKVIKCQHACINVRAVRQAFYLILINNALRSHKKLRAWIFEVLLSQIRKQNVD